MEHSTEMARAASGHRTLLGRDDWLYLLALLVPFAAYDLALKASLIVSRTEDTAPSETLGLMRSDVLFNLGYGLVWVALFAVARRRPLRPVAVLFFHVVTVTVALVKAAAHRYFETTGSPLDWDTVVVSLSSPEGSGGAIASAVTPGLVALVSALAASSRVNRPPPSFFGLFGRFQNFRGSANRLETFHT